MSQHQVQVQNLLELNIWQTRRSHPSHKVGQHEAAAGMQGPQARQGEENYNCQNQLQKTINYPRPKLRHQPSASITTCSSFGDSCGSQLTLSRSKLQYVLILYLRCNLQCSALNCLQQESPEEPQIQTLAHNC